MAKQNASDWFGFAWLTDDFVPSAETTESKKENEKSTFESDSQIVKEPYKSASLLLQTELTPCTNTVADVVKSDLSIETPLLIKDKISERPENIPEKTFQKELNESDLAITNTSTPTKSPKGVSPKSLKTSTEVSPSSLKSSSVEPSPVSKCSVVLKKNPVLENLPRQNSNENVFAVVNDKIEIKKDTNNETVSDKKRKLSSSESTASLADVKTQNSSEKKPEQMVFNADLEVRKSGRLKSAKCSSRYRGDYGIRVDVYTKLSSRKINDSENEAVVSSESSGAVNEETKTCKTGKSKQVIKSKPKTKAVPQIGPKDEKIEENIEKGRQKIESQGIVQNLSIDHGLKIDSNADSRDAKKITSDKIDDFPCQKDEKQVKNEGQNKEGLLIVESNDSIKTDFKQTEKTPEADRFENENFQRKEPEPKSERLNKNLKNSKTQNESESNAVSQKKDQSCEPINVKKSNKSLKKSRDANSEIKKTTLKQKTIHAKRKVGPVFRTHVTLKTEIKNVNDKDICTGEESAKSATTERVTNDSNDNIADTETEENVDNSTSAAAQVERETCTDKFDMKQFSVDKIDKDLKITEGNSHSELTKKEKQQYQDTTNIDLCDNLPNVPFCKTVNKQLDIPERSTSLQTVIEEKPQASQTCEKLDLKPVSVSNNSDSVSELYKSTKTTLQLSDIGERKSTTSGYIHGTSKFVSKQLKKRTELNLGGNEVKSVPNVLVRHSLASSLKINDTLPIEDTSVSVLESLRLRLFASAGIKPVEVVDKPKVFESKIKQPKVKIPQEADHNSIPDGKMENIKDSSLKSDTKIKIENESNRQNLSSKSSNLSGHSTPRSSTPNSEILEEVSKNLECLQKAKRKLDRSLVQKPKRPRFEQKKFMLRSMVPKQPESDSESHSSVATENSDISLKDCPKQVEDPKLNSQTENKTASKQFPISARGKTEAYFKTDLKCSKKEKKNGKVPKQVERKQPVKPKPAKCHACGHVFKSKDLLKKHYPCRMRQTRTWSQNKLRPNRVFRYVEAPPKEQGRKRFICLLPKSKKQNTDKSRPQLMTVRKTKFKRVKGKRRRKLYQILQELAEKRKPRTYPHLCVNYENMNSKSQFFYKLGLVSPSIDQHSNTLDYFNPEVESFFQGRNEHDKENRYEGFKSEIEHGLELNQRGIQCVPSCHEKQTYAHFQKSRSIYTIPLEQLVKEISDRTQKSDRKINIDVPEFCSSKVLVPKLSDKTETPPVLEKYERPGEIELFESDIVIDKAINEPPILELQFDSPKKAQKERHFLDFVENIGEKAINAEEMHMGQSDSTDGFKISVNNLNKLKDINSSLQNSPSKQTTQRHFTDIIDVTEVTTQKESNKAELEERDEERGEEQSDKEDMTLAEIREILKPKSSKENAFSKESLLKLRADLAKLLANVKTPVKNDVRPLVQNTETASNKTDVETLGIDFSAYERKSLFESMENVDASNFERQISEETGGSGSETDLSCTGSEQSDPYKSSLEYEQDLLPITFGEGDSLESTTKGCITDNILQMLSTLEDKGSVAENMSNLLQILAENLGIIDSSSKQELSQDSTENEDIESLTTLTELASENNKSICCSHKIDKQSVEMANMSPHHEKIVSLKEKLNEKNTSSQNLHTDQQDVEKIGNALEFNQVEKTFDSNCDTELSQSDLISTDSNISDLKLVSVCKQSEVPFDTIANTGALELANTGALELASVHSEQPKTHGPFHKKESALFKSITELNSIETDSDSNLGESYDADTMSRKLAELKATNYDASASDVNSDALSDYKEHDDDSESETVSSEQSKDIEKMKLLYSTKNKKEILMNERPVLSNISTTSVSDSDTVALPETPDGIMEDRPRIIMKIKIPAGATYDASDDSFHKDSSSCTSASVKSSDASDVDDVIRFEDDTLIEAEAEPKDVGDKSIIQHEHKFITDGIKSSEMYIELNETEIPKVMDIPHIDVGNIQDNVNPAIAVTPSDSDTNLNKIVNDKSEINIKEVNNIEAVNEVNEILSFPRKLKLNTALTIGDSFDYESDTGSSGSFDRDVTIIPRVGNSPEAVGGNKCSVEFDFKSVKSYGLGENENLKEENHPQVDDQKKNISGLAVSDEKHQDSAFILRKIENENELLQDLKITANDNFTLPLINDTNDTAMMAESYCEASTEGPENKSETEEKDLNIQQFRSGLHTEDTCKLHSVNDHPGDDEISNNGKASEIVTSQHSLNVTKLPYIVPENEEAEYQAVRQNTSSKDTEKSEEELNERVLPIKIADVADNLTIADSVVGGTGIMQEIYSEDPVIEFKKLHQNLHGKTPEKSLNKKPEEGLSSSLIDKQLASGVVSNGLVVSDILQEPDNIAEKVKIDINLNLRDISYCSKNFKETAISEIDNTKEQSGLNSSNVSGSEADTAQEKYNMIDASGKLKTLETNLQNIIRCEIEDSNVQTPPLDSEHLSTFESKNKNSASKCKQDGKIMDEISISNSTSESTYQVSHCKTNSTDGSFSQRQDTLNDNSCTSNVETKCLEEIKDDRNIDKMKLYSSLSVKNSETYTDLSTDDNQTKDTMFMIVEESLNENKTEKIIGSAIAENSTSGSEMRVHAGKSEENQKTVLEQSEVNTEGYLVTKTEMRKDGCNDLGTKVHTVSENELKTHLETKEDNFNQGYEVGDEKNKNRDKSILKGRDIQDESMADSQNKKKRRISFNDYLSRVKKDGDCKKKEEENKNVAKIKIGSKTANQSFQTHSENNSKFSTDIIIDEKMYDLNEASANWHNPSLYSKNVQNEIFRGGNKLKKGDSGLSENVLKAKLETSVESIDDSLSELQTSSMSSDQNCLNSNRFVSMPLTKKSDIMSIENKSCKKDIASIPAYSVSESKPGNREMKKDKKTEQTKSEDDVLDVFDSLFSLGETVLSLNKAEEKHENSGVNKSLKEDDGNLFSALDTLCKVGEGLISSKNPAEVKQVKDPLSEQVAIDKISDVTEVIDLTEILDDSLTEEKERKSRAFFLQLNDWLTYSESSENIAAGKSMNELESRGKEQFKTDYSAPGNCLSVISGFSGVYLNRFRYNVFDFEDEFLEIRLKEDGDSYSEVKSTGVELGTAAIMDNANSNSDYQVSAVCSNTELNETLQTKQDSSMMQETFIQIGSIGANEGYDDDDFADMLAAQMALNEEAKSQNVGTVSKEVSLENQDNENAEKFSSHELIANNTYTQKHSLVSMEYDNISEDSLSDLDSHTVKSGKRRLNEISMQTSNSIEKSRYARNRGGPEAGKSNCDRKDRELKRQKRRSHEHESRKRVRLDSGNQQDVEIDLPIKEISSDTSHQNNQSSSKKKSKSIQR